ncbi:MAG: UvrD-helicase domain-containing protein [Clostridia bacterium]|nr:UvrD-helicase domain-containing protein [Clostridia bacterium]
MPDDRFTDAQNAAILHHDGDLLVSAGAGSGKTRTLTEKVTRYLLSHPDKDATSVLAVTFTNAAASELREKIAARLTKALSETGDSRALYRQIASLERAPISTIHAFCLRVLRPRAAALGLPPDFAIADTGVAAALRAAAMADAVDETYEQADEAPCGTASFRELAELLGSARNTARLERMLSDFAVNLREMSSSPDALREAADRREREAGTGVSLPDDGVIASLAGSLGAYYAALFASIAHEMAESEVLLRKYVPIAEAYAEHAARLMKAAEKNDLDTVRHLLSADLPDLRSVRVKDEDNTDASAFFKAERPAYKKRLDALLPFFDFGPEEAAAAARQTARIERALADVVERFEEHYTAEKQRRGLVDYGDLERYAKELLTDSEGRPTPAAAEIAASYDRIFVDEYQDTNRVQDAIFRAIAKEHDRFLVGDVKQSIYGFRGAEPALFSEYRRAFPALDPTAGEDTFAGDASVFMSENFRCDAPIIAFTNLVSDAIFPSGGIGYTADDRLIARKTPSGGAPVEIAVVRKGGENDPDAEVAYVARRVKELLRDGYKNDGSKIEPSDIAVLLRSPGTSGEIFARAFAKENIPAAASRGGNFFREPEILLALDLMRSVDNPTRDVPLAGCLKSPLFGFSIDDLARLRLKTPHGALWDAVLAGRDADDGTLAGKCRTAAEQLTRWRRMSRGTPSDKLIQTLYRETAIAARATAPGEDGDNARAHLMTLYDMARQYEGSGFGGLFGFLRHIDDLIASGETQKNAAADRGGAVRIMSIHDSKGLEFPVVFVSRAAKGFNMQDANASLLFEPDVGISTKLPDETGLVLCDTRQHKCAAQRIRIRAREEEMRILYVAMTRARERLIITGESKDPLDLVRSTAETLRFAAPDGVVPPYLVLSANDHLSWVLLAAEAHPDDGSFVILTPDTPEETDGADAGEETAAAAPVDEELAARLAERFDFRYPYEDIAKLPAKLIVSRLHPGIIDTDEPDDETYTASGRFLAASDVHPLPSFLSGMPAHTAAEVGIATHAFFEFCRLDALSEPDGIGRELARLVGEKFITEEMARLVRREQIEAFLASPLCGRMRRARRIEKEFRFYAAVEADRLTNDPVLAEKLRAGGADVLVQGVVDCFFEDEDGKIVLIDYKTDRLTTAELADRSLAEKKLRERHTDQLTYYRKAVEKMLGRPVDEVAVYSLPLGDTVEILKGE